MCLQFGVRVVLFCSSSFDADNDDAKKWLLLQVLLSRSKSATFDEMSERKTFASLR